MKKRAAVSLLIIAAVLGVYAPALLNGFVWDDTALVLRDPLIRSWRLIAEGFRHFLFTDATASNFYRPLQRLTYVWDYAWFAFRPWAYHLTNIALHAGAAVMLFLFLEKWLSLFFARLPERDGPERNDGRRSWIIAAVVSLTWAIHPLHTSAVTYISGRADLLAALFGFAGLYVALRRSWISAAVAALCFFAAMLSKESGVVLLLIAILLQIPRGKPWRLAALGVLVITAYCGLRFSAEHQPPPPPSEPIAAAARPIVAVRAFAEYAGLLVLPMNLHMERDVMPFGREAFPKNLLEARMREYQTLLGIALLIAFAAWTRWARRSEPPAFVCLLSFLMAYLPISNVWPLNASVAEHWLYVPCAFLLTAAALSLLHVRLSKSAALVLIAVWMSFLAGRTFVRNFDWRDQRTFIERTVAAGGNSARMLTNLGALELSQGHNRYAIGHFTNALALSPNQPFALLGLGAAYLREKDFVKAREQFEKAARNPFVQAEALQDLAVVEYQETHKDTVDLLSQAARLAPKDWAIQRRYIGHLADRGDLKEAIAELQEVLQAQWWRGESWRMLGDLWLRARMADSAERAYTRAASLDVHDDESRRRLSAF